MLGEEGGWTLSTSLVFSDFYRSELQNSRVRKLSKLLKRRFEIEKKMLQCAEEVEKAQEATQQEFDVALKGRIEALQVGPSARTEIIMSN